jgi:hypothetical protein
MWRRLDAPGHEIVRLEPEGEGWKLSGAALFTEEGIPCQLTYEIRCDSQWHTMGAEIRGSIGTRDVRRVVTVAAGEKWMLDGVTCPAVTGCVDIDIAFTPSTNTLPIRRLSLAIGEQADVRAAWLSFPALEFEVLPQRYCREGERTYRYESNGGRFMRILDVNDAGMVLRYPGLWEAESEA